MMSSPTDLPLEFYGDGTDVTHQFTLLSGVYKFQFTTESSGYFTVKLYDPKGNRKLLLLKRLMDCMQQLRIWKKTTHIYLVLMQNQNGGSYRRSL